VRVLENGVLFLGNGAGIGVDGSTWGLTLHPGSATKEKAIAAIIRIAGIYGPGQNALATVKAGRARRIVKPGQVFNRIHVDDLAGIIDRAIEHALSQRTGGVFNAADDEPTAPGDPIAYAAGLLGVEPPPEVPFEEAKKAMSTFAVSFYGESKRVRNNRLGYELGVTLRYPSYREGLRALFASGEGKL